MFPPVNPEMLPQLAKLAPTWCSFFGGSGALQELVVHLALGCESGGAQAFSLLLDAAGDQGGLSGAEREACRDTLGELTAENGSLIWQE